jgi:hypothetical protein
VTKEKIYPPHSDCFSSAWSNCFSLWPLFLVQLGFVILQYVTLFFCAFLLVGPFLEKDWSLMEEGFKDPKNFDWTLVGADAAAYFINANWILIFLGVIILYLLWWSLLSALSDGGVYRAFWGHLQNAEKFSLKEFFKNGAKFLLPILFLQMLLFMISIIFFALAAILIVIGTVVLGVLFAHSPLIIGISLFLIGVPFFIIGFLFLMAFGGYVFLWKAEITRTKEEGAGPSKASKIAWDSMWEAGRKFRENRWRIGIGLTVAFLVYVIVSFVLRFFLELMGHLPYIGFFFNLSDLITGLSLVVLLMNYMPALSTAYLSEEEM